VGQFGVQRQPQPVPQDHLVGRGDAGGQRHRGRERENLADYQVIEKRSGGFSTTNVAVKSHNSPV
jgi:hypothetical protein